MAETQPQVHPALLRLSAMISHYFNLLYWLATVCGAGLLTSKLSAHFLDTRSEDVNLLLQFGDGGLLRLDLAVRFEELIQ